MPKPHTLPTLFDELKTLSISFLGKNGYLKHRNQSGTVIWKRNGEETGSISIHLNITCSNPFILLKYRSDDIPREYAIKLVKAVSNLGKGYVWYFLCPSTGKPCRKLYLFKGYFYHRSALNGCMYEKQTQTKKHRYLDKYLGEYYKLDHLYCELHQKHLKKTYAGKPTKKYLRLIEEIRKAESIPYDKIERLMMI